MNTMFFLFPLKGIFSMIVWKCWCLSLKLCPCVCICLCNDSVNTCLGDIMKWGVESRTLQKVLAYKQSISYRLFAPFKWSGACWARTFTKAELSGGQTHRSVGVLFDSISVWRALKKCTTGYMYVCVLTLHIAALQWVWVGVCVCARGCECEYLPVTGWWHLASLESNSFPGHALCWSGPQSHLLY